MVHARQHVLDTFLALLIPVHALSKHGVRRMCAWWRKCASPSGRPRQRHVVCRRRPRAFNARTLFLEEIIVWIFSTAGGGDEILERVRAQQALSWFCRQSEAAPNMVVPFEGTIACANAILPRLLLASHAPAAASTRPGLPPIGVALLP